MATIIDKIRDAVSQRSAKVAEYHAMLVRHEAAAAEDAKERARKQAKVDELDRPRVELAQFDVEAASRRHREERDRAQIEADLRADRGRDLDRFAARVDRIFDRMRLTTRPHAEPERNAETGRERIRNLPEIQKWLALGPLMVRLNVEIRDDLWKLDPEAQRRRLTALRQELDAALEGTPLASEADA